MLLPLRTLDRFGSTGKDAALHHGWDRARFLRLRVGSIPADAKVEIRIAGTGTGSMLLFANSKACTFLRTETVVPKYTNHEAMVFAMENDGKLPPFIVLEMRVPEGEIVVDYAEAHVMPAG